MSKDILRQLSPREAATVTQAVSGLMQQMVKGNSNPRQMAVPIHKNDATESIAPIPDFDLRRVAVELHAMNISVTNPRIEPLNREPHRLAVKFDVAPYGADKVRVERIDPFKGDREMETRFRDIFGSPKQ